MKVTGKRATGGLMKSPVIKRSIIIRGHKTSISLEDAFWSDLKGIAHSRGATVSKLVTQIDETRQQGNLSSAIRLYVLKHIREGGLHTAP
jgi:predicted DNA-binding ribbon-helix-helix protein